MTDAEYDEVMSAAVERVKRTTFAAPIESDDEYTAHATHAEYGASRH